MSEPSVKRRRLTAVLPEEHHLEKIVLPGQLPQNVRTAVDAAVIDRDHLEGTPERNQGRLDLREQRRQVVALVVHGQNNADFWWH